MINKNKFSIEDLTTLGLHFYEILGSNVFNEKFVKPLGVEIINKIAYKVHLKTPILQHKILSTNKKRIGFLHKIVFTSNSNKPISIHENQIPIIDYSTPVVKFNKISQRREKATKEDIEIIKLCIESYLSKFGYEKYLEEIEEFLFEIFRTATHRFSELFSHFNRKINFTSRNNDQVESVIRKIQLEFSTLDKQLNSPFILVVSRVVDITYEWIEMECEYLIYQSKVYFSNSENNSSFYITHDEHEFLEFISRIPLDNTYIRLDFLHKPPKKKEDPNQERTLIEELRKKVANDNSQPLRRVA